jgi:hypothetical protein
MTGPTVYETSVWDIETDDKTKQRKADEFDILHFHIDFLHAPLVHDFTQRTLTTLHGRLDLPHIVPFYRFRS